MRVQETDRDHGTGDRAEEPGSVELVYALDDESNPRRITVFPRETDDVTTTWITMDVAHAVDPFEMA